MSKPKIVSDYLEAAVPKGLTESRRKLLTDELESHICDKAEHYIEIGYPEDFILVEFDINGKVCGKEISLETSAKGTDPDGLAFYCERLKPGMSKQEAADILSSPACEKVFESIYYKGDTVTEVQSYFAQEEKHNRTVFGVPLPYDLGGESRRETFQATLVFENSILKEPPDTKNTDDIENEMSGYDSD